MIVRSADAVWEGTLKNGKGTIQSESCAVSSQYSYSRFIEKKTEGSNPDELIAAAHAGCFSMALSFELEKAGFTPSRIKTAAHVHLNRNESGFFISQITLTTQASVPNISDTEFQQIAEKAKIGCPVSQALRSIPITLSAALL